MQIQVQTDNHTAGGVGLTRQVESVVEGALERFGDRIKRVEVHFTDENGTQKSSHSDKRCVMEARLAGLKPITVSAKGSTLRQALDGAAAKLEKTLTRTPKRLDDSKGRTSYAGDDTT